MMSKRLRTIAVTVVVVLSLGLIGGCTGQTADDKARNALQDQKATGPTLEKTNLEEKRKREENPDAINYVYLMNFGQVVGYYVAKGKISNSSSQATPEQSVHWTCGGTSGYYSCSPVVVDGPQDDGSYGGGDPGIFFFLTNGTKIVTSLDYIQSDQPIPGITAPKLGG
jgi:hypothetical protein